MALEYFTEAELRALPDMSDVGRFPLARVESVAADVVATIEREVGTSFIGRTVIATYDGGWSGLVLREPYVLSITSASVGGVPVSGTPRVRSGSVAYLFATGAVAPTAWPEGYDNVSLTYVAGYSATPPADVKAAAMRATRAVLLRDASGAGIEDRATTITTDMGTMTIAQPGTDQPFGLPNVDSVVVAWRNELDVMGFA